MAEKTVTNICPECGEAFECKVKRGKPQKFCSQKCCLRAWRRERHTKDPEKVRAEWRTAYERSRPQRLVRMRQYHADHRDEHNAKSREDYAQNREKYHTLDKVRWTGERREKGNQVRRSLEQEVRLSHPWKKLLLGAKGRARKKKVSFSLTNEWAEARWTGKCELTGLDFVLGQRGNGPKGFSPSIDRIKPELGYVPENCRFVIWAVNAFKHEGSDEEMYFIAEVLLKFRLKSIT